MAIDKIHEKSLAANAITEANISSDLITQQTELAESANENDAYLLYDNSAAVLKKILSSNVVAVPTFSSISPTNVNESASSTTTFTITGAGFTEGTTASLVTTGGSLKSFDTVTRDSSTQLTCVVTNSNLSASDADYGIQITNGKGFSAVSTGQISFNASPIWSTAAGSLGNVFDGDRSSKTFTITATDPESTPVTINTTLVSGSLPAGATLTDNGDGTATISGFNAVGSDTTSTFTVRANDSSSNFKDREFSITVKQPVQTAYSYSGSNVSFTVPTGLENLTVTMWGAGGGFGSGEGYNDCGGAGGYGTGIIDVSGMSTLIFHVAQGGGNTGTGEGSTGTAYPGAGANTLGRVNYSSGGGGGYSGVFNSSVSQANALLVAGGGGGAGGHGGGGSRAGNSCAGGNGGGEFSGTSDTVGAGYDGYNNQRTPDAGDPSHNSGNGWALTGGSRTHDGGAGGGGYWGGDSGNGHGGGGGGEGYYNSTYVSSQTLSGTAAHSGKQSTINPPQTGNAKYANNAGRGRNNAVGDHGRIVINY